MITNKSKDKKAFFETLSGVYKKAEPIVHILLPILILAFGVGTVLYYILGPSQYYLTSDSTDSMRWAQATFESGKLISDNSSPAARSEFNHLWHLVIQID